MSRKKAIPKTEKKQVVAAYEPTPLEKEALAACRADQVSRLTAPKIKLDKNVLSLDHPDQTTALALLMHSMGTTSAGFVDSIVGQLVDALTVGMKADQQAINFGLAVIAGIKPKDEIETMLAAQMAAIHMTTMTFAQRIGRVENIPQQDSAERALNKLARTFTTQMEALKRYRTGGEQKVTVHHVTVNEGGQAIVGNVQQRGEG